MIDIERKIAQLNPLLKKLRNHQYSDNRKEKYRQSILKLVENTIKQKDSTDKVITGEIIDGIQSDILHLENSVLNAIPFELVNSIYEIADEWIPEFKKKFVITTNRTNNAFEYYIILGSSEDYRTYSKNSFDCELPYELIYITIPSYLVNDYLSNIVLFHEFGHFIDNYYQITKKLFLNRKDKIEEVLEISQSKNIRVESHLAEYFADIFAAQYIGNSDCILLTKAEGFNNRDSITHPADKKRANVVMDFCENKENDIIRMFNEQLNSSKLDILKVRYKKPEDSFKDFLPCGLQTKEQISGVLKLGWDIWNDKNHKIHTEIKDPTKSYKILNNLIEKSISNYFVQKSWSEHALS
jgi:hypothetical protein